MARIVSIGGELNSLVDNVEWSARGLGSETNQTTIVRSGTYAPQMFKSGTNGQGYLSYTFAGSAADNNIYVRTYLYITTLPSATIPVLSVHASLTDRATIRITNGGVLQLWNASAQVGSDSAALSTGQWYLVEMHYDSTLSAGSDILEARLSGISFASSSAQSLGNVNGVRIGALSSSTYSYYFDDIAVNNPSGSFQNSWPGAGQIVHLRPNADGDSVQWGEDYTEVDEVTPDDNTTRWSETVLNDVQEANLDATPGAIGASDTINCVQVGVRFRESGTSESTKAFCLRIKAAASGTVEESSAIDPNSTTWVTNAIAAPRNYALTLYDLPGASTTAWTKSNLDTAQIGARITTAGSLESIQVSTMWLLVDSTPAAGGGSSVKKFIGVNQASLKKVMGVAEASIKKLAGVTN